MSEEKLYVVKNDKGYYWDFEHSGFWEQEIFGYLTTPSRKQAGLVAFEKGGNVVTLIEEPEKVVLTKEQAEIVENAHVHVMPACYISKQPDDEELLMNAYVNGYTVKKKYLVYKVLVDKQKHEYFAQAYRSSVNPGTVSWFLNSKVQSESLAQFTEAEIEHYGLQDCEKEEVADD
ncbi:DUF1642 domain-containing protein [Latilactobacillus curvatus]